MLIQGVHRSIRELLKLKNTASMGGHALAKEHRSRETVVHRDIVENSEAVTRCDLRPGDKVIRQARKLSSTQRQAVRQRDQ